MTDKMNKNTKMRKKIRPPKKEKKKVLQKLALKPK